ncbi:hypothetical protein SBOR_9765 [Sclerotinia borealis F-4128]|uniref:Uncharacterized protein n=1 Tax=Sclerotinia borealis (strain F-4128) TaxID=1432307 RepID=W9BZ61_SCLBF|nr:hypothetical protein SBOR_9765 [Sclerotinia borealis F-4128]
MTSHPIRSRILQTLDGVDVRNNPDVSPKNRLSRREFLQWRAGVPEDQIMAQRQHDATPENIDTPIEASLSQQIEVMQLQHDLRHNATSFMYDRIDESSRLDAERKDRSCRLDTEMKMKALSRKNRSRQLHAMMKDRSCRLEAEMKTKFMNCKFQLAIQLSQIILWILLAVGIIAMFYTGNDHIAYAFMIPVPLWISWLLFERRHFPPGVST